MIGLQDLTGLWRRRSIAWPDGRTDTDTEVFWLQGPHRYADLRIPAGRPSDAEIACLRDLDRDRLRAMARQEGFFGTLDVMRSVACWHRDFDYRPDTGIADRGSLAFEDGVLIERGIEQPYIEHWLREAGSRQVVALSLTADSGVPGCLVVAGDAFIYARGRATPLPAGSTLEQLIEDAASLAAAQNLFDCEISFGHRHCSEDGGDWRIARSSHGFREGAALSPLLDDVNGYLSVDDLTSDGAPFKRTWRIAAFESAPDAPLALWFGAHGGEGGRRGTLVEWPGASR
ncbi:MAG: hypothetical protein GC182_22825 [Rhodopseudomonas sp.]|nr:hypothetical protein [Rhodopseudomonas sp.]